MTTVTIQQNVGGYTGTIDTYLREGKPTTQYTAATQVYADGADSSGVRIQGLLSFANIFGDGTCSNYIVTCYHSHFYSCSMAFYNCIRDLFSRDIPHSKDTKKN